MKYKGKEMPPIVVDGIIVDDAARNRYTSDDEHEIIRMARTMEGESNENSEELKRKMAEEESRRRMEQDARSCQPKRDTKKRECQYIRSFQTAN